MIDICEPCKNNGKLRARYKTIGGVPMCGGCVADYEAKIPAKRPFPIEITPALPKPAVEKEVSAMDKCGCGRDAKHRGRCSFRRGNTNGTAPAGGGEKRSPKIAAHKNGNGRYSDAIGQLKQERERLDTLIAGLEELN